MSYTSYSYLLIFLGSVFLCYTLSPKKYKWVVLLVSSYIFYMINSGKLAVFLVITTAAVYFAGVFINKINDGFALAKKGLKRKTEKNLKRISHGRRKQLWYRRCFLFSAYCWF